MKLTFTVPKGFKLDLTQKLIQSWINDFGLNEKSATLCLIGLKTKKVVNLDDKTNKLSGECYVEDYASGFREVTFSFSSASN